MAAQIYIGREMRILYSHRIQSRDGQSVHVEELVAAFRAAGHEVRVVGPGLYDNNKFGDESLWLARFQKYAPAAIKELAELAYNILTYRRLSAACREFSPDFIYERYNLFHLAGSWLARRTKLPLFLEVNSPLADERIDHSGLQLKALARATERFTWRSATRVLAVTQVLKDIIVASGIASDRVHVVPNGVVLERFDLAAPRPPHAGITIGFLGFVRSWHGMDGVLNSMSAHNSATPVRLMVVGDGPARSDLERQAAALNISDSVIFTGVVGFEAVPDCIRQFDIAIQPKVVAYASPLKIFDYMAAGLAIVAPDQPNIRELLQHGVNGLLFDPDQPGAMWQAIVGLIEDPERIAVLARAARADLEARGYTWRANAERIVGWAMDELTPGASGKRVETAILETI